MTLGWVDMTDHGDRGILREVIGMTIRQHLTSTARIVTTAGLCASIALGSAVVATPASADSHHYRTVIANSSWMNLSVRGGSTDIGTDIIQWWADNNADQQWAFAVLPE
ncbi:MAG TPA: hypothetical protein VII33_09160 [Nakamurella sp.]